MDDEKLRLFRMHPASDGLDAEELKEIAASFELVQLKPGTHIQRANESLSSVYLLVRGRLRITMANEIGSVILERDILPGDQFGGVATVLDEPSTMNCLAVDPTTVLMLSRDRGFELFNRFPRFRQNFTRIVAHSVKNSIRREHRPHRPPSIGFFHHSPVTRRITAKLFERLAGMDEVLRVLSDQPVEQLSNLIHFHRIMGDDSEMSLADSSLRIPDWLKEGRVVGDLENTIEHQPPRSFVTHQSPRKVIG